ncbi:hypothetical protein [Streptomyces sp. NPDC051554]|uniref:hypothetical protein n=1 Tax=Streptomyces sp. NPDC051554 TaxID=3365656 RepID=UPI00378839A7
MGSPLGPARDHRGPFFDPDATGLQRPAFSQADDTIHGNLAFGRLVVGELLDRGL